MLAAPLPVNPVFFQNLKACFEIHMGAFNNYVDKMREGGGSKKCLFFTIRVLKMSTQVAGGVKKWQSSVHVVIE